MIDWSQLQSVVHALGWALIHFLWQGLAIAGAYWLVCRLTPQRNAAFRYWSGMLAFLVAVVLPVATFTIYWPSSVETAGPALLVTPLAPVAGNMGVTVGQAVSLALEPAIPVVVALWALGVGFLSVRAGMGWVGALRLVRFGTQDAPGDLQAMVEMLKNRLGVRQAVRILESARVQVPTVVGWIKPAILLPAAVITSLPREQLEMVIAHELGHVRRYDYLFNLMQLVVETLFFYHPAIRWMSRQVRQEREHCCDDLVVARCERPVLYAKALANLEALRDPLPAVALAASGGDLLHRVRRIIQKEIPGRQSGFTQLMTMLAVAALVGVAAVQGLEMRQGVAETQVVEAFGSATPGYRGQEGRTAWVQGTRGYSVSKLEAERTRAARWAAARANGVSRATAGPSPAEQQQSTGADAERLDSTAASERAGGLPEAQTPFAPVTPAKMDRDEVLTLASAFQPTRPRIGSEAPARAVLEENRAEFEILPETAVAPVYPFKARRKRIDGYVKLEFSVSTRGRAENIRVVEAYPEDIFEKAAVSALEKWRFKVEEGYAGNGRLYQTFDFGMEEAGEIVPKKERRCDITGTRICGLQRYND